MHPVTAWSHDTEKSLLEDLCLDEAFLTSYKRELDLTQPTTVEHAGLI